MFCGSVAGTRGYSWEWQHRKTFFPRGVFFNLLHAQPHFKNVGILGFLHRWVSAIKGTAAKAAVVFEFVFREKARVFGRRWWAWGA